MANRSMLLISNSERFDFNNYDENEDIIAAANYSIPLFWFGLYSSEDIIMEKKEMDDGTYKDCPILVVKLDKAKQRVKDRKKMFLGLVSKKYEDLYDLWTGLIEGVNAGYIHIEMSEIWVMADNFEKYNEELAESLMVLDSASLDTSTYQKIFRNFVGIEIKKGFLSNNIVYPEKHEHIVSFLCGYSWIKEVPWEK